MINLSHSNRYIFIFYFFIGIILLINCNPQNENNLRSENINLKQIPFANETISGNNFNIKNYSDKNILLNFWFPSCPPCIHELDILNNINEQFESTNVIGVQALGLDTKEDGIKMLTNKNISYTSVADEKDELITELEIKVLPTTILYNADGNEVKRWIGIIDEKVVGEKIREIESD